MIAVYYNSADLVTGISTLSHRIVDPTTSTGSLQDVSLAINSINNKNYY